MVKWFIFIWNKKKNKKIQILIISLWIFPPDDQEHEWIVRTCRKAWDEVCGAEPEKSAAARCEESSNVNF